MIRVLCCGSTDWDDYETIRDRLDTLPADFGCPESEIVIVHGDAKGADYWCNEAARALGYRIERHPPRKDHPGGFVAALHERVANMVNAGADLTLAFYTGKKRRSGNSGTMNTVILAADAGIRCEVIPRRKK